MEVEKQTDTLDPQCYLVRSPFLAWRIVDGEAVIISPQERALHNLNEAGTEIWKLADGSRTLAQIAQELTLIYDVTFEEAVQDVLAFVQELSQLGVVFVCDHPTSEEEIERKGG